MLIHPKKDDQGEAVKIKHPHAPSPLSAWEASDKTGIVVPGGAMPVSLNGIALAPWLEAPLDRQAWEHLGAIACFEEPSFEAKGFEGAAGAVVVETDGRIWIVAPSNEFGGYKATFPKGKCHGLSLRATAIKEVFEESGLHIELLAHLVDVTRSTSRTRYYLARRVGGNPSDMGWESQAVMLCPAEALKKLLNRAYDHQVVDALLKCSTQCATSKPAE